MLRRRRRSLLCRTPDAAGRTEPMFFPKNMSFCIRYFVSCRCWRAWLCMAGRRRREYVSALGVPSKVSPYFSSCLPLSPFLVPVLGTCRVV